MYLESRWNQKWMIVLEGNILLIQEGYWNLYMPFHIQSNEQLFRNLAANNSIKGVIGGTMDDIIFKNNRIKDFFETRKLAIAHNGKDHKNKELEPERGFSNKEGRVVDSLLEACEYSLEEVADIIQVFNMLTQNINKEKWMAIALMPLEIKMDNIHCDYCPLYIYLFENGYGVIRTSIRMVNIESSIVSTYPMGKWFEEVKMWQPLTEKQENKYIEEYRHVECANALSITNLFQQIIENIFNGNLLEKNMLICFETFTIAKAQSKPIWDINTRGTEEERSAIYSLANPEEIMYGHIENKKWKEFWEYNHSTVNGIEIIHGNPCRAILFGDKRLLEVQEEKIENLGGYFNLSISKTFEMFLIIALCQKDSELYLYQVFENDQYSIDKEMVKFNLNQNFFDGFLDVAPINAKKIYYIIKEINSKVFSDVNIRVNRIQEINTYQRSVFLDKKTYILEVVALVASVLFGLPMINDTIQIIRSLFLPNGDWIEGNVTGIISFLIWSLLIITVFGHLLGARKEYSNRRDVFKKKEAEKNKNIKEKIFLENIEIIATIFVCLSIINDLLELFCDDNKLNLYVGIVGAIVFVCVMKGNFRGKIKKPILEYIATMSVIIFIIEKCLMWNFSELWNKIVAGIMLFVVVGSIVYMVYHYCKEYN